MRFYIIIFLFIANGRLFCQDTLTIKLSPDRYKNTEQIQKAFDTKTTKLLKIVFGAGKYYINGAIRSSRPHLTVESEKNAVINFTNAENSGFIITHDYFTLRNSNLKGNGSSSKSFYQGYGVLLNGASFCKIIGCSFSNISGNNIFFYPRLEKGSNNNLIKNNIITNPMFNVSPNGDESAIILGYSGNGYSHDDNIIENNIIDGNNSLKVGISILGHGQRNIIRNNEVKNCIAYGILLYESENVGSTMLNNKVLNNLISNIGEIAPKKTVKGMGIYLMTAVNSEVSGNRVNNVLRNSDQTETLGAGAISVSLSPNVTVQNNIINGSYMYGITSDYSFGSKFIGNTITNTRKSGMYFINMNNVEVSRNSFKDIGEVVLKGYFENTSLPYIKEQLREERFKNLHTGNNFKIEKNNFYTSGPVLYFSSLDENKEKKITANRMSNNVFQGNTIYNDGTNSKFSVVFQQKSAGQYKVFNNKVLKGKQE